MLCAVQQAGHRDHPTPNVLVSQPDDLGFGVALGSAGEEDGIPRGDVCVLRLGRDPGSFCTNKETENFLVLSRQGSKDPSDTPYVMSKSQVFKLYATTNFPTKWHSFIHRRPRDRPIPTQHLILRALGRPHSKVSRTRTQWCTQLSRK